MLNDLGYSMLITLTVKSGAIMEHFFNQGFFLISDTDRPTIPWSGPDETTVQDEPFVHEDVTDLQVAVVANKVVPLVHVDPCCLVRDDIIEKTFLFVASFNARFPLLVRFLHCVAFSKTLTTNKMQLNSKIKRVNGKRKCTFIKPRTRFVNFFTSWKSSFWIDWA